MSKTLILTVIVFMLAMAHVSDHRAAHAKKKGGDDKMGDQIGIPLATTIPQHGHSRANDGGILGVQAAVGKIFNPSIIPTGTWTPVSWDREVIDTLGIHDTAVNNSRFTIPPGYSFARVTVAVNFSVNGTGNRQLIIRKNGADISETNVGMIAQSGIQTGLSVPGYLLSVNSGDYIEAFVFQTSGVDLAVTALSYMMVNLLK